ncbi:unnamed protein product [Gemmata massiliana]|uniref:Uncharacterized protein n=1 Tax=Gemmata massiliana TaxID=1210884 RepID=A0A6P2D4G6_9BACT|nr:unnamed protein product [Gemmata massiliana]
MHLLRSAPFTLVSPLSPDECAERLRTAVVPACSWEKLYVWLFRTPLSGEVSRSTIRVRAYDRPPSFYQLCLTATLQPHGTGTRLHCCIKPTFIRMLAAVVIWGGGFAFGFCISLTHFIAVTRGEWTSGWSWFFATGIVTMPYTCWLLHHRGPQEAAFLERVLVDWLGAKREQV